MNASGHFGSRAVDPATLSWLQFQWPCCQALLQRGKKLQDENILLLEHLPIILACTLWWPHWQGSLIVIHCDSSGSGQLGLQQGAPDHALTGMPTFHWDALLPKVQAEHVPGVENGWADAISQLVWLFCTGTTSNWQMPAQSI